jgi:hypothetical protein
MEQFLADLHKPQWWIGVVIVGVLLDVAGSYARTLIDASTGRLKKWSLSRSAAHTKEMEKQIEFLRNSLEERRRQEFWILTLRGAAGILLQFALLMFVAAGVALQIGFYPLALIATLAGIMPLWAGGRSAVRSFRDQLWLGMAEKKVLEDAIQNAKQQRESTPGQPTSKAED